MTTTTATLNLDEVAEFWRIARRLYSVYIELDHTFELDVPTCPELEDAADSPEAEARERVLQWFEQIDGHVQVWQLRQLLQSTSLQNEENLRYLIVRHLNKKQKSEADKDKVDFLLVQYFAHCAPHGLTETALAEVARVLEPAMGKSPKTFPDWASSLDAKLGKLNESNSLEELQNSGALQEVRELKLAVGDDYFEPGFLVAFTRFNFLARRAFFRAMHLDLHAIRESVNELERLGFASVDCRDAGLTESESLEQVRHVVHQWKTPFRAPYSGGSSFLQLILLRHCLQRSLEDAGRIAEALPAVPDPVVAQAAISMPAPAKGPDVQAAMVAIAEEKQPAHPTHSTAEPSVGLEEQPDEDNYLTRCVVDIAEQLKSVPAKNFPAVTPIVLGGCKLLIATWEAQAFVQDDDTSKALQRTVAARTILHVCVERHKKNEPTDLAAAMDIARIQVEEMKQHVEAAKEAKNIDAAVNLAATSKRLLSLIVECEKAG
jgi:hypothetical protein